MGICIYCHKPAGFFRWSHKTCRQSHKLAEEKIPEFFVKALDS
jgi:hypothetical protein